MICDVEAQVLEGLDRTETATRTKNSCDIVPAKEFRQMTCTIGGRACQIAVGLQNTRRQFYDKPLGLYGGNASQKRRCIDSTGWRDHANACPRP